jgi:hypothetical protein
MNQNISILPVMTGTPRGDFAPTPAILRLVLYQGELGRLPAGFTNLRVMTGMGWATVGGQDFILTAGERLRLSPRGDVALVSVLGQAPLVLEVQS